MNEDRIDKAEFHWLFYRGQPGQHERLVKMLGRYLPHVWTFAKLYDTNPAFRPDRWTVVWPHTIYESDGGRWLREQYGNAMLHDDGSREFIRDAVWAITDTQVFFLRSEDCFACQMRFR
ncbi:MAG: hypothetical protein EOP83_08600 [Verrucomicrobiaceae bacterium]|nr:MAG: hypothetical protein EOP83_08600 [Verrucomicrobiaceae bacterium]